VIADTIAYLRVSTQQQTRNDKTSLEDQRRAIAEKAQAMSRTVGQWFSDEGVTGTTAEGRPGFMQMLGYCQDHPRQDPNRGVIVVLNDSRFARLEAEEAAFWRFSFKRLGWDVRFVEGGESADPMTDGILRAVYSTQAAAYSANLSANVRRGARGTAEQGFWRVEAPIGYRRRAERNGTPTRILEPGERKADDERVRLHPGPESEQALVRSVFDAYAGGTYSLGSLARHVQARSPDRKWSKQSVRLILENPAYKGTVAACHGEVIVDNAHPALVAKSLWDAVQDRLTTNKRQTTATAGGYPLSGLITCGQCGSPFTGGGGPKGPPGDPDRYRFYRCSGTVKREPVCGPPTCHLSKRHIEPAVIDAVADVVSNPVVSKLIEEEINRVVESSTHDLTASRRALQAQRDKLTRARTVLVRAVANETMTEAEAAPELASIREQLATVGAELDRLRFEGRRTKALSAEKSHLLRLARDFGATIRRLSGAAQRELLRPWLQDATVDKHARTVVLTIRRIPAVQPFLHLSPLAGARLTVMRLRGKSKFELAMAEFTRSRPSFTAPCGRPTVANDGNPLAISVSTSTTYASIPNTAAERTRASTIWPSRRLNVGSH